MSKIQMKGLIPLKNKEINENIHKLQTQINDLVINDNPNTDAEVVQARAGNPTLNDRLNKMDTTMNEITKPIDSVFINSLTF